MLLVLGAYVTLLPALLGLFNRYLPSTASAPRDLHLPFVPSLMRAAPWITGVLVVALIAVSARAKSVRFDADFGALDRLGVRPPYVLFVGRITDQKGIFHLLEAARRLPSGV